MDSFIQGKATKKNIHIKRFGYLLSALLIIITSIGVISNWSAVPWLFLVTMYFLTGSLWIPVLIKPFYKLFGKYIVKPEKENVEKEEYFNEN